MDGGSMRIGISTSVIQRGQTGVGQYLVALVRALLAGTLFAGPTENCSNDHEYRRAQIEHGLEVLLENPLRLLFRTVQPRFARRLTRRGRHRLWHIRPRINPCA